MVEVTAHGMGLLPACLPERRCRYREGPLGRGLRDESGSQPLSLHGSDSSGPREVNLLGATGGCFITTKVLWLFTVGHSGHVLGPSRAWVFGEPHPSNLLSV